jgi:hypothetical protein
MAAVHLKNAYSASVCGRATKMFTEVHSEVTCKQCLRSIGAAAKKGHEEKMHAADLANLAELAEKGGKRLERAPGRADVRFQITYSIETKIVGVTHPNEDGSERQTIISTCAIGEELKLVREPQCPFDSSAIGVFRKNGEQLEYLSREFSGSGTAAKMDRGENFHCHISNIVGGYDGKSFGVNIELSNCGQSGHHLRFTRDAFQPRDSEPEEQNVRLLRALAVIAIMIAVVYILVKYV